VHAGAANENSEREERQFDVENDHNRRYLRTIRFSASRLRCAQPAGPERGREAGADAAKPDLLARPTCKTRRTITVTVAENRQLRLFKTDFEAFPRRGERRPTGTKWCWLAQRKRANCSACFEEGKNVVGLSSISTTEVNNATAVEMLRQARHDDVLLFHVF
jgi:hypothetical protein